MFKRIMIFVLVVGLLGSATYFYFDQEARKSVFNLATPTPVHPADIQSDEENSFNTFASYNYDDAINPLAYFEEAAQTALPAVVHISVGLNTRPGYRNKMEAPFRTPFRDFFGDEFFPMYPDERPGEPMRRGSGSGVIISSDGYIVTNNHVVANGSEVEVILNDQRQFPAKVIGTDPSTDIALIKIESNDLPTLSFGNSDNVRVGSWVMAVGNPFNLTSTVTAGIVSAKGRNINIVKDQAPIESFIQTDAVVNPGNSGGALIDLGGRLIGINTAIASPTGVYAGYAFAVPSSIVQKVVSDLKEYGVVQRAFLGVTIRNLTASFVEENNLKVSEGVYVDSTMANSAAKAAGLRQGDVIVQVAESRIRNSAQLLEAIGRQRPGDEVTIVVDRTGKEKTFQVTLRNGMGTTDLINEAPSTTLLSVLGAEFKEIDRSAANSLGISGGVQISKLQEGLLVQETKVREGFIITMANKRTIRNLADLEMVISNAEGSILLEGVYPNSPKKYYYAFGSEL